MKGDSKKLVDLLEGREKKFTIPLYQRNYDWKIKHCEQLFYDIIKIHEEKRKHHFFGCIVTVREDEYGDDFLIIDGQQRLTSISMLILAMINAAKNGDIISEKLSTIDILYKTYIINEYQDNERKVKLKPIKNDQKSFDALVYNKLENLDKKSNIAHNYDRFYQLIKAAQLTLEQVYDCIKKLIIIDIRLNSEDDPQLIFESLNSTGLELTEADKIRNFLLMSVGIDEQERLYESYWNKIEENTDYNPTLFIRDYMTIHTRSIANIEVLYEAFKSFQKEKNYSREKILKEMASYSTIYYRFNKCSWDDSKIDRKFLQLSTLNSTVGMTFYIAFLDYAVKHNLAKEEIYEVFDIIEGYWARRIICNYPANALNKAFATLHHEVTKLINDEITSGKDAPKYVEVFKYVLLRKKGTGEYPRDLSVNESFGRRQIYRIPASYRNFLFERLENGDNVEGKWENIVPHMRNGSYTIEHIMPQTLNAQWREMLGPEAEEIHENLLHTFGNLTLTGYNSSYGNRSFKEKKEGYKYKGKSVYGFKDSRFWLTNFIKGVDQWTKKEIIARNNLLLDRFLNLWPLISTDFRPTEKEFESIGLEEEDAVVTYRNIASFKFRGDKTKVSSWKDMLVAMCSRLLEENRSRMKLLCENNVWVHNSGDSKFTEFGDNCYVFTSCDTKTKLNILRFIFANLNINESELVFELDTVHNDKVE